jgi:polysaccharide biosynthesis protein VpsJ
MLDSIRRLDAWLVSHNYQAYDPFDGLNAWLRPLALGSFGKQLLQQGVRRFPINLRPLLGIRPAPSSKGHAYLARGYLRLHRHTHDPADLDKATACLDWLKANASRDHGGLSWGNHFDYQSRVFYLPKGTPTIVWVSLIGQAFVDAWEATGRRDYLDVAVEACEFIMTGLERRPEGKGVCLSYIPGQFRSVHNANMLGAALLARVSKLTNNLGMRTVAREAVNSTVGAQHASGAWWYGEADNLHWVDNFHTGYVLDSLWCYFEATGDHTHRAAFDKGADFYIANFFLADGTPKYYAHKTWPLDIQCASQAIETLTLLARVRGDASLRELAHKVAAHTVARMQDRSGYFYFRRMPFMVNRTPTLHWGQATMLHALAGLLKDSSMNEEAP